MSGDSLLDNSQPLRGALQQSIDSSLGNMLRDEYGRSVLASGTQPPLQHGVPCRVDPIRSPGRIAIVHAHGLMPGTAIPRSLCLDDSAARGMLVISRALSAADAIYAYLSGVPNYAIDRDTIYRINGPTVAIDTLRRDAQGALLLGLLPTWRDGQQAIARTGPFACVLP